MDAVLKYKSPANEIALQEEKKETIETFDYPKIATNITPVDVNVPLDSKKYLLSKTDPSGVIEYCNKYFCEVTGYDKKELIGQPHSIVRHPDMPGAIFHIMWEHLHQKKSIPLILKNMTKKGHYFWIQTEINIKMNKASNEITGYFAYQRKVPQYVINTIEPLYYELRNIEKQRGLEHSVKYLKNFLAQREQTFEEYMQEVHISNTFAYKLSKLSKKLFTDPEKEELLLSS